MDEEIMDEEMNISEKKPLFSENAKGLLCYLLFWLSGIIVLLLEKKSEFVRFHALQSIVYFAITTFVYFIFVGIDWIIVLTQAWEIPGFLLVLQMVDFLVRVFLFMVLISWIYLMNKAYKGDTVKLPVIGDKLARRVFTLETEEQKNF